MGEGYLSDDPSANGFHSYLASRVTLRGSRCQRSSVRILSRISVGRSISAERLLFHDRRRFVSDSYAGGGSEQGTEDRLRDLGAIAFEVRLLNVSVSLRSTLNRGQRNSRSLEDIRRKCAQMASFGKRACT